MRNRRRMRGMEAAVQTAERSRFGIGWEGPTLLVISLVLFSFGLVVVYSASAVLAQSRGLQNYHFVVRQAMGGVLGLAGMVVMARLNYRHLRRLAWPTIGVAIAMLLLLILPWTEFIAPEVNGARRWLNLGSLSFQPSEAAKIAIIIWTAALAVKKQEYLRRLSRGLMPFLIIWSAVMVPILLQPNVSSALLVVFLAALVVLAAGARFGHFALIGLAALPVLWTQITSAAYRMRRIQAYMSPGSEPTGVGYQINQSLIALGSGGLVGRGVGQGQQKFGFLPEPHNDFVFAMIGEEWGFIGVAAVVLLFTAFGLTGYRIARQAPDLFGSLLAIGLTNLIVLQALLHMAVNTALVPTTGLTLPFMSYGRSSLVICLTAVGVLVGIARAGEEAMLL